MYLFYLLLLLSGSLFVDYNYCSQIIETVSVLLIYLNYSNCFDTKFLENFISLILRARS